LLVRFCVQYPTRGGVAASAQRHILTAGDAGGIIA
jgi:hypothetical protein